MHKQCKGLWTSLIAERYFLFLISSIENMKKVTSFKNHPVQLVTHYYLEKIGLEEKGHVFITRQKDVAIIEKMGSALNRLSSLVFVGSRFSVLFRQFCISTLASIKLRTLVVEPTFLELLAVRDVMLSKLDKRPLLSLKLLKESTRSKDHWA